MRKGFFLLAIGLFSLIIMPRQQGFCLKKIQGRHPFAPQFELKERVDTTPFFNQPYSYLGSGKECYAFVSRDDLYVIKFFKQKHLMPKLWHRLFPLLFKEKIAKRAALREKCLTSYWIAYHQLAECSGLLYLHLNASHHLKRHLSLTDQYGRPFKLNLDDYEFIVQRKATPLLTFLDQCEENNDWELARSVIESIAPFIEMRYRMGIEDSDLNCTRNLGYLDGKIISIDVGEFRPTPPTKSLDEEIEEATRDLTIWLDHHRPELKACLSKQSSS